ncbi:hypothetical protein jhhlp_000676 [Lomentospora prolificans]|uniref:Polymerase beta nucleotidyltransferase domain-containing protein n=1 Tax=Lomentospora prolificans TaxID=41688 RepID=A0A2N3NJ59_9PEZI|nr:hypothetical protein jhhlp_000676 [Lomentospora prolificans]
MHEHHQQTIEKAKAHFEADSSIEALLLCGSIAHGYANAESDIDVLILLSDEDHAKRESEGLPMTLYDPSLATYEGGYVDGKYISKAFIRQVIARGSEPARYAFDGVEILFNRTDGLEDLLKEAATYPTAEKNDRIIKFHAQFEAWKWFCCEAKKKNNPYLLNMAVSKLVLFGTRLILAYNELLYPFHKWMLKVLEGAKEKPEGMVEAAEKLCREPTSENIEAFYNLVKSFRKWEGDPKTWSYRFLMDVELTWMDGWTSVDDI